MNSNTKHTLSKNVNKNNIIMYIEVQQWSILCNNSVDNFDNKNSLLTAICKARDNKDKWRHMEMNLMIC
jgi:hypothetical protein